MERMLIMGSESNHITHNQKISLYHLTMGDFMM